MKLPHNGREYVNWPITGQPVGASFEVSLDDGLTWQPMETTATGARLLMAGPEADPGDAVVITAKTSVEIRLTDNPEIVVRHGGFIELDNT